jgi:alkylated DNA nucleotide flippase Atl1
MQPKQLLTVEGQLPRFSLNIETTLLIERIKKMAQGDLITYGELAELIGQDAQREARHILLSARRICQREYQVVTDAKRNIGIRRLTDVELTSSGLKIFSGLRRAAKRGIDRVTAVADFDTLPDEEKVRHNSIVSVLAVVRHMSRPKSLDRIAGAVNTENTGQLPIARTLELFRGPKKV